MEKRTVAWTVQTGLCTSCGICKGVCPRACISLYRDKGIYLPKIDEKQCINCGLCARVCPGLSFDYEKAAPVDAVSGEVRYSCNAWSRDAQLRHVSASGGVVSTMLEKLLREGAYDAAFCVEGYHYTEQLKTAYQDTESLCGRIAHSAVPKSRYLAVSHEHAAAYICANRDKRVILIGTSCAVRGLLNVIREKRLNRDQYLLIGLFCDQVFNYNVYAYFRDEYAQGNELVGLHFKNKESGGWPGNLKFLYKDGSCCYQDKSARMDAKHYFASERCLYCVDKLNVCADISLGDNYTEENSSALGSNSVLIRTQRGEKAWTQCRDVLEEYPVALDKIRQAQYLSGRIRNLYFGDLKQNEIAGRCGKETEINTGILREEPSKAYRRELDVRRRMLNAGAVYDCNPGELTRQRRLAEKRMKSERAWALPRRVYQKLKRMLKRG